MSKAEAYLERRLDKLTNPYAVALTSYALATNNKLNRQILYNFAAQGFQTKYLIAKPVDVK